MKGARYHLAWGAACPRSAATAVFPAIARPDHGGRPARLRRGMLLSLAAATLGPVRAPTAWPACTIPGSLRTCEAPTFPLHSRSGYEVMSPILPIGLGRCQSKVCLGCSSRWQAICYDGATAPSALSAV